MYNCKNFSRFLRLFSICGVILVLLFELTVAISTTEHRHHHGPPGKRHSRHLGRSDRSSATHGPELEATKLRRELYSDHMSNEVPPRLGNADVHSRAATVNHKPSFRNCSNYQPSILEAQGPTAFLQVKAEDNDPPDQGGTVTYSLVIGQQEMRKFSIDNITGELSTTRPFNRDEPEREREAYVTVRATDNARPPLDDICTIQVKILDVNDNPPMFDKANYAESVPQDFSVGMEVMRISATDVDDGNNSFVTYTMQGTKPQYDEYFDLDSRTGVITLKKSFFDEPIKESGDQFMFTATAQDHGNEPKKTTTSLSIEVIDPNKKQPEFLNPLLEPIFLDENYKNFSAPIYTLIARSNVEGDDTMLFELVTGRTEQTNKLLHFVLKSEGTQAHIKLGKDLDYETTTEFILTVRVQNKHKLAAETTITIKLRDVNDNIPQFPEVVVGSVAENQDPHSYVMQVKAIDNDGTSPNNDVMYELGNYQDKFSINPETGDIETLQTFDREENNFYALKVIAKDGYRSSLLDNGEPNRGERDFRIEIADVNDNSPTFTKSEYLAEGIVETANVNSVVTEVEARDVDSASVITYSIISGNNDGMFKIDNVTGTIKVAKELDYEKQKEYTLIVQAFDSVFTDEATVRIKIQNENDEPPVFLPFNNNLTLTEEQVVTGCLTELTAIDPDVGDITKPQNIVYFVSNYEKYFQIDNAGCLTLKAPLDRDPPDGYPEPIVVYIIAEDENGGQTSQKNQTEVYVKLLDINDNAPFLNISQPVVWYENQNLSKLVHPVITVLQADDNDEFQNGPPFDFEIDDSADAAIKNSFDIVDEFNNKTMYLVPKAMFDREFKKQYEIPVRITDSGNPRQSGTSMLTVIIGDENDNPMSPGTSSIFVYNYKGLTPSTEIGRVYVEDRDDWDLPDKTFRWKDGFPQQYFDLNENDGMITMKERTPADNYTLDFTVTESSLYFSTHDVDATVYVTVKEIPEEAVDNSGSIRFLDAKSEDFVIPDPVTGLAKKDILRGLIAKIVNASEENVDVFTVLHSPHSPNNVDVRFSAHGSPYYKAELLNGKIQAHQQEIENELGMSMFMVNIDECLFEKAFCELSCVNILSKDINPYVVYTNTSSFVGVRAIVDPQCACRLPEAPCYNGGTVVGDEINSTCICPEAGMGPHCEKQSIGFNLDGWAWYPSLSSCGDNTLAMQITSSTPNGLILYAGPLYKTTMHNVTDFMSLELMNGNARLIMNYGTGTVEVTVMPPEKLTDNQPHNISIVWSNNTVELSVDNCHAGVCLSQATPMGPNQLLNVNGPLQVGGASVDLEQLSKDFRWYHVPTVNGFQGCVENLVFNSKFYNLGEPSNSMHTYDACANIRGAIVAASIGVTTNFLIAILVCILALLILVLAVVVHRRRNIETLKDLDDIRENIINYNDEGGGEDDMTGYDLKVLQTMDQFPITEDRKQRQEAPVPGDIKGFLNDTKDRVDHDPENMPFDDVRHYAYEGDGNSTGSLSSLQSGTDDGDLNFDYLSNFGPRFRKLADMYGEHSSDEEDENYLPANAESFC